MTGLVITCRRPGLIRAGVRHPPVQAHAADAFTAEQLHELLAEPEITVVLGELLTADGVSALAPKKAKK